MIRIPRMQGWPPILPGSIVIRSNGGLRGLAKGEGGKKATLRSIVAVARKLSVLLHRLWASGEFYKPFPKIGLKIFAVGVVW